MIPGRFSFYPWSEVTLAAGVLQPDAINRDAPAVGIGSGPLPELGHPAPQQPITLRRPTRFAAQFDPDVTPPVPGR